MDRKTTASRASGTAWARQIKAELQDPTHTLDIPHRIAAEWIELADCGAALRITAVWSPMCSTAFAGALAAAI